MASGGTAFKADNNDFGFDLGVGAIGFFNSHVGLRGDVRYFRSLQDPVEDNEFDIAVGNPPFSAQAHLEKRPDVLAAFDKLIQAGKVKAIGASNFHAMRLKSALDIATREGLPHFRALRDKLWNGIKDLEEVYVNGDLEHRIPHNINVSFNFVEGESLIMAIKDVAVSSGSACTSASLEPSYVLRALGRSDELAHSSIRFTLGKYTTEEEVDYAIDLIRRKIAKLRELSPLWEMHKEGIDLNTVQWAAH